MKQFFLFLLIGLVLVLIQAMPLLHVFPCAATPNLSFVFVIFLALYYPSAGSCFVVFLLGYVLETLSGMPAGLGSLVNLASFFLIRASSRVVQFEGVASRVFLVFALSFVANLFLLKTTQIVSSGSFGSALINVFTNSLSVTVLCVPLFVFCINAVCTRRDSI